MQAVLKEFQSGDTWIMRQRMSKHVLIFLEEQKESAVQDDIVLVQSNPST